MRQPTLDEQLSQAAREDASDSRSRWDERWDRLAAGTLTEEEHDELRGLADASGAAHEAYQAFKPLGPAFQKNAVAALLAQQRLEKEEAAASLPEAGWEAAPAAPRLPEPARGKRALAGIFGGVLATMVAGILFFQTAPLGGTFALIVPPMSEHRSPGHGDLPVFNPGDRFHLDVEATGTTGELDAKLFVLEPGGRLLASGALPALGNGQAGLFFVPTVGADLPLPLGPSKLVVVVARPGKFPSSAEIAAAVAGARKGGKYWRALARDVELQLPDREP